MDALEVIPSSQQEDEVEATEDNLVDLASVSTEDQTTILGDRSVFPPISSASKEAEASPFEPARVATLTRVENSQETTLANVRISSNSLLAMTVPAIAKPSAPAGSTAFLCADSMPFSLATQSTAQQQKQTLQETSVIEDTENVALVQSIGKAPAPTIFVTGSNLSSMETVSVGLNRSLHLTR